MNGDNSLAALTALRRACRRACFAVTDFRILSERFNLVVHLWPLPVVARIATGAGPLRQPGDWMRREVEVTRFLAGSNAPAVRPSGPILVENGFAIGFWAYVETSGAPLNAFAAGAALRACHLALATFKGHHPVDLVVAETRHLLAQAIPTRQFPREILVAMFDALAGADAALTAARPRRQSIHGDADWHNVLTTAAGPVWIDWEDTHLGPIEWDIASAVASLLLVDDTAGAREFLSGYGGGFDARLVPPLIGACFAREALWSRQKPFTLESGGSTAIARLMNWQQDDRLGLVETRRRYRAK